MEIQSIFYPDSNFNRNRKQHQVSVPRKLMLQFKLRNSQVVSEAFYLEVLKPAIDAYKREAVPGISI